MEARLAYAASQGKTMYPDANGSLRFTYGKVTGKAVDGQIWTAFTTAEGIVAKHTGRGEFDAPDKMIELIKAKDYGRYVAPELGTLPVDFMSTVDITNGNSGSSSLMRRASSSALPSTARSRAWFPTGCTIPRSTARSTSTAASCCGPWRRSTARIASSGKWASPSKGRPKSE